MQTTSNLYANRLFSPQARDDNPLIMNMLEGSWAAFFRDNVYPLLDTSEVEKLYCSNNGRSTKNLNTMLGLTVLQANFNLTDEEAVFNLACNTSFQMALRTDSPSDKEAYICAKTFWSFKQKLFSTCGVEQLFTRITNAFVKDWDVNTGFVRIDSTHVFSNMKNMRRAEIFRYVLKSFLTAMEREQPAKFARIDRALVKKYLASESGYDFFNQVKPSQAQLNLEKMASDMYGLLRMFRRCKSVTRMKAYQLLHRIFGEQCKIVNSEPDGGEITVKPKEPKEVRSDSLQGSDPEATYDAHKGKGYQAQIVETCSPDKKPGDGKGPELVLMVIPEPAHNSDSKALVPAVTALAENGLAPKAVLGDTSYGGDANQQALEEMGIRLLSPVSGKNIRSGNDSAAEAGEEKGEEKPEAEAGAGAEAGAEAGACGPDQPLTLADFETDDDNAVTACPEGQKAKTVRTKSGGFRSNFDHAACSACPRRGVCPVKIGKRTAGVSYSSTSVRVAVRRAKQETSEFKNLYRCRSGIEATNSQLANKFKMKRLRVRGQNKVKNVVILKVLCLNISRVEKHKAQMRRKSR